MRAGGCHCLPGSYQGQPLTPGASQQQPWGCGWGRGLVQGKSTGWGVRGADPFRHLRAMPLTSKTYFPSELTLQPLSVSVPALLFSLPLVTSLSGMSKCKMQKPGRTTQPEDQLWLVARAVLPP